ncbi:hypothetical protein ACLOJK_029796 [Asimina triloba]
MILYPPQGDLNSLAVDTPASNHLHSGPNSAYSSAVVTYYITKGNYPRKQCNNRFSG